MIRRATPGEAGLLQALTRAAFAETATCPYPSSALRESWDEAAAAIDAGVLLLVSDDGDHVVGACRYRLEGRSLYFTRLCVLPGRRRRGHAGTLLDAVEAHAANAGCARVECSARSAFPDNRNFYLRRGYEVVGYEDVYGVKDLRTNLVLHLRR
ncbi:MAG: N-acetyltransferase family protein [Polyangiales bacterium]